MKKYLQIISCLICLILTVTSCGMESRKKESEDYDILAEEKEVFDSQSAGICYGMQFYGDDMIQIMQKDEESQEGIWILKTDGDPEKLLPEYSDFSGYWFLTSTGMSVLLYNSPIYGIRVQVLSPEGETLFSYEDMAGRSICETEEGKIYLLAKEDDNVFLAEMNLTTGSLRKLKGLDLNLERRLGLNVVPLQCLGTGPDGLMLMDCDGIWRITEEDGNTASRKLVLSFEDTSYMDMISNPAANPNFSIRTAAGFRMQEDGSTEILWKYDGCNRGLLQTLRYEKTDAVKLRLRCLWISAWMSNCITEFNHTNGQYRVVLEQPDTVTGDLTDYLQRTDMEIGAGGGADLIIGGASQNLNALVEKGALVNLTPYLEQSGIAIEDYFPAAFAQKENQTYIYGIMPELTGYALWISREVLEDTEGLDIAKIVDALSDYPGNGSFQNFSPQFILNFFFEGSENFWGMVDYEQGKCDFNTDLFQKILCVAKRYIEQTNKNSPAILGFRDTEPLGLFESEEELLEQGKNPFGYCFDDGVYPMTNYGAIISINNNSENKEGCWQFMTFLLQEETQRQSLKSYSSLPANRNVFAERQLLELELSGSMEHISGNHFREYKECTKQDAKEQLEFVESLHFLPIDTQPVKNIIWDEAKDFFDDVKPMDVIIENINNRVQLYLNER